MATTTTLARPAARDLVWLSAGALLLGSVMVTAIRFRDDRTAGGDIARKAGRIEAVAVMRAALSAAAEAEKSAVMAVTDEESLRFANEARARTAEVEKVRAELAATFAAADARAEREALAQFSTAFAEFRRVDGEILALAVRNSNLKAFALAFDPAAKAIEEMEAALERVTASHSAAPDAGRVLERAFAAERGALRIEVRLAPHIAEESEPKMDELEAAMSGDDERVRAALDELAAIPALRDDADLRTAAASYARFGLLRTRILTLSRENTNVRSATLSLREKQRVMMLCRTALDGLEQAIGAEPPTDYGRFGRPVR